MWKIVKLFVMGLAMSSLFTILFTSTALVQVSADNGRDVRCVEVGVDNPNFQSGDKVRLYAVVKNAGTADMEPGTMRVIFGMDRTDTWAEWLGGSYPWFVYGGTSTSVRKSSPVQAKYESFSLAAGATSDKLFSNGNTETNGGFRSDLCDGKGGYTVPPMDYPGLLDPKAITVLAVADSGCVWTDTATRNKESQTNSKAVIISSGLITDFVIDPDVAAFMPAEIDRDNNTIKCYVSRNTNLVSIKPNITLYDGKNSYIDPEELLPRDFSEGPVEYTVHTSQGQDVVWVVTVKNYETDVDVNFYSMENGDTSISNIVSGNVKISANVKNTGLNEGADFCLITALYDGAVMMDIAFDWINSPLGVGESYVLETTLSVPNTNNKTIKAFVLDSLTKRNLLIKPAILR